MKSHYFNVKLILICLLALVIIQCKKETPKVLPTLNASTVSNITANSATIAVEIITDGGADVTARGVCWSSTNSSPTISDSKTNDGTGLGVFTSSIIGLKEGVTYYLRAYATNSVGTAYYSQSSFKTLNGIPTITTTIITSITESSFISGGIISNDGGYSITSRGVCWSKNQNPTLTDCKTSNGIGSGSYNSSITGLTPATNYYVRAYATNSFGTGYGDQIVGITTPDKIIPIINLTDPTVGKSYLLGSTLHLKMDLSDNIELKSYKVVISKSLKGGLVTSDWSYNKTWQIVSGTKTLTVDHSEIVIPLTGFGNQTTTGHYDIVITCTDTSGNEAIKTIAFSLTK